MTTAAGAVAGGRRPAAEQIVAAELAGRPREGPARRPHAALFGDDRAGFVERWIVAEALTAGAAKREDAPGRRPPPRPARVPQPGLRRLPLRPGPRPEAQKELGQTPLTGLGDRMSAADLAAFLGNPHGRYPDGRMPRLPVTPDEARDIAAYLLLWSKPTELARGRSRRRRRSCRRRSAGSERAIRRAAAAVLLRRRAVPRATPASAIHARATCRSTTGQVEYGGCFHDGDGVALFTDAAARRAVCSGVPQGGRAGEAPVAVLRAAAAARSAPGCVRCHQRDSDRPPPIEEIGSTLGGAYLQELPFQRTPRLTNPHQKFTRVSPAHRRPRGRLGPALAAVQLPDAGLRRGRGRRSCRRWPRPTANCRPRPTRRPRRPADPTLGTLHGSRLVGFQGYALRLVPRLERQAARLARPGRDRPGPDADGRAASAATGSTASSKTRCASTRARRCRRLPARQAGAAGVGPRRRRRRSRRTRCGRTSRWEERAEPEAAAARADRRRRPRASRRWSPRSRSACRDGKVVESLCILTADNDLLVYDLGEAAAAQRSSPAGRSCGTCRAASASSSRPDTPVDLARTAGTSSASRKPDGPTHACSATTACADWRAHSAGRFAASSTETAARWTETLLRDRRSHRRASRSAAVPRVRRHCRSTRRSSATSHDLPAGEDSPPTWEIRRRHVRRTTPRARSNGPATGPIAYPRPKTVSGEDRVMPGGRGGAARRTGRCSSPR